MLCIIKSKACKKCGGDLSLECDIYGVYIQCIQCGANWNESDINLKPKDVETILKARTVRRPSPELQARKTTPVSGVKRVVIPYPEKPAPAEKKPDQQAGAMPADQRSNRPPAP